MSTVLAAVVGLLAGVHAATWGAMGFARSTPVTDSVPTH